MVGVSRFFQFIFAATFLFSSLSNAMISPRIVGGNDTTIEAHPWQIWLSNAQTNTYCGGVIIAEQWVLTAAHCVSEVNNILMTPASAEQIEVYYGETEFSYSSPSQYGELLYVHQDYYSSSSQIINDIALIYLSSPLVFSDSVAAIDLATTSVDSTISQLRSIDRALVVTGWGRTTNNSNSGSDTLQEVSLSYVSDSSCRASWSNLDNSSQLCASTDNGQDSCNGDSGGPLSYNLNGIDYLVGLVSYGDGNGCASGVPGVYSQISYFVDWIDQVQAGDIEPTSEARVVTSDSSGGGGGGSIGFIMMLSLFSLMVCRLQRPALCYKKSLFYDLGIRLLLNKN
ncbi:serine protease [Vibrio sp. SS-MA-C1-2]|uniref:S1 family peptidase n=1 Tax=Vibrio sp. SS-MA-C1-2 TaxID=2908646 RepID=UPI001F472B01|nr:serine protease [Vibrio sp. SS-MA-C1-2]UJF18980.1 serine protease [Vibrio sp. SS-MA-C1-2]